MAPLHWLLGIPAFLFVYVLAAVLFVRATRTVASSDWRAASREPVGLAPDPVRTHEAVVQVYAARALSWRGYFAVHPWIAVKRTGAPAFTVYEVNGWRLGRLGTSVLVSDRPPDGRWFGNRPQLLADRRGPRVDELIDRIEAASDSYPWKHSYHVWPGPNSNTFIAHVLRAAPELRVDLPPTAIGKDYLGAMPVAKLPSGTGAQVSVLGVLDVAIGWEEGVEINLLGLTFGIDPRHLVVKLPLIGSLGPKRFAGSAQGRPPLDAPAAPPALD
ncbi:MAG: DUF3750 domain-containing protein [Steroidobacteraceae bacterium]